MFILARKDENLGRKYCCQTFVVKSHLLQNTVEKTEACMAQDTTGKAIQDLSPILRPKLTTSQTDGRGGLLQVR